LELEQRIQSVPDAEFRQTFFDGVGWDGLSMAEDDFGLFSVVKGTTVYIAKPFESDIGHIPVDTATIRITRREKTIVGCVKVGVVKFVQFGGMKIVASQFIEAFEMIFRRLS
jgi:hypothetical protein